MKTYNSFEEIDYDLERLKLERQISIEKLKGVKDEFAENLKPILWVGPALKVAGKVGIFLLLRKMFR